MRDDREAHDGQVLERQRMAALATLSAGVAHQINHPLTYLLLNVEYVMRRLRAASASDDPMSLFAGDDAGSLVGLAQSLQHAVDGGTRIRRVVRDLMTFAQGSAEHRMLVDLRGVVESATQMAWHEICHRARFSKVLAEVPLVDANEARLRQVFLSLLVNAAQAIPEGQAERHEVRVATRTDEHGNAVVEVSDTGVGIAPHDLARVFDPFFTTKGFNQTGLGLAISHGTIKSLGGDIVVASKEGQGTTFRVILRPADRRRSSEPASSRELPVSVRHRLLIVEDDLLVARALARALSEDSDVEVATDAQQALARLGRGESYDVILCDLMMPVMSGMDLYAEVVRRDPGLAGRFVFMTGGAFTPRAQAFVQSIVNPCLQKPLDMTQLRRIVSRARQYVAEAS